MATLIDIRLDLDLIKVEVSTKSQVLTAVVEGTDHFTCIFLGIEYNQHFIHHCIFCDGTYVRIPLEVMCEFETQ